jgi:CHAT domain-containing protein
MPPAPDPTLPIAPDELLASLTDCPPEALTDWSAAHRPHLHLSFLQTLKARYATGSSILATPLLAEQLTRYALVIAEQMPHEVLALPLAQWARGNWAMYYAPDEAIHLYQQAQSGYQTVGDPVSVARLAANLIGVFTECGRFTEGEAAYQAARPEVLQQAATQPLYLVRLDQNYGWLLHNQGRYAEALAIYDRTLALIEANGLTDIAAEIRVNRNLSLGMLGRLAEVEAGFLQERAVALAHQQQLTVARIDMNLGDLYSVQGRPAAALRQLQQAQQAFTELANAMEIGSVALRQASLFRRIGAIRAAIRAYAQALDRFTRANMTPQIGETLVNYAAARRQTGDYAQAAALLDQAEQVWQSLHNPHWLNLIFHERVLLALELGDIVTAQQWMAMPTALSDTPRLQAEFALLRADLLRLEEGIPADLALATTIYETVYNYAEAQGYRWLKRQALIDLGKLYLNHDSIRARTWFEQAIAIDEAMRQTLTVEELKAGFHEQANDLFSDLIRLVVAENQPWLALHYSWRAKAGALLDLLQTVETQATLPVALSLEIEQTRQQIATLRWQLADTNTTAMPQSWQEQTHPELIRLEQQLLTLRRQRNAEGNTATAVDTFADPTTIIAQMQADVLLEYICCGDELLGIYADSKGHCFQVWLGDVEAIADLNARLQLTFEHVVNRTAQERAKYATTWRAECRPLLAQCYQSLVAPLLAHAPAAAGKHVLIAPCAPLFLLPFAAFWDGQRFWAEADQIELIPSGALLAIPQPSTPMYSPPLIIAAAAGNMTAVRREANAVAAALPESITFLDTPALAHISTRQTPPRLLHIAAHTILRDDAPIFSGLQLAGEVLTVEACYTLPLQGTELVTLSGCTTAGGQESESSLLALQSAFFVAGAQRVLSSLWPVADDATAVWMDHFYRFLARGLTIPQAVQQTQGHLLADPSFSHPAIWAAFACARR